MEITPHLNVVLIEPEIGANTGNIGRTCVGLKSKLHLVGKLGFEITDKRLRRRDWITGITSTSRTIPTGTPGGPRCPTPRGSFF